jgi:hypothetical protein
MTNGVLDYLLDLLGALGWFFRLSRHRIGLRSILKI